MDFEPSIDQLPAPAALPYREWNIQHALLQRRLGHHRLRIHNVRPCRDQAHGCRCPMTARIVDRNSRISGIVIANLREATDANSLRTCTLTIPPDASSTSARSAFAVSGRFSTASRTPLPPPASLSRNLIAACSKADWMRISRQATGCYRSHHRCSARLVLGSHRLRNRSFFLWGAWPIL